MPANTSPIFTNVPDLSWVGLTPGQPLTVSTVNTTNTSPSFEGTTNAFLVYTAGSNGSFIQKLVLEAAGNTGTAAVLRIHINNGTSNTSPSANSLYMQYTLPVVTQTTTTAGAHIEIPLMLQLQSGYRIYVSMGSSANLTAGWYITAVAGDY
jgi:hypothetical protein